jgi:hypothetical protein
MRDHGKSGMSSSGSENQDERIGSGGSDEKIGAWSEDDEDGVLAGDEDVGVWSDEENVQEGYQAQPGGSTESESERPDDPESRWGSDDSHHSRR